MRTYMIQMLVLVGAEARVGHVDQAWSASLQSLSALEPEHILMALSLSFVRVHSVSRWLSRGPLNYG